MSNLIATKNVITSMKEEDISKVCSLEEIILSMPQYTIPTSHILHAGMYSRTIVIPKGMVLTGSLINIATMLIMSGDFVLFVGDEAKELHGYNIFACEGNRKQAGVALTDTHVTMIFPTEAKTVEEAEEEFTNEAHKLWSRKEDAINEVIITGR